MRRTDNVFLLTLVDFLVQVIFFGLFVFVVYQASQSARQKQLKADEQSFDSVFETAGVSNITELLDELSKLAPVRLKGFNTIFGKQGGGGEAEAVKRMVEESGGAAGLEARLERLAKLEEGMGKPPCLFETRDGKRQAVALATVIGSATTISFVSSTPQLEKLLAELGLSYGSVRSLGLSQFRRTFRKVIDVHPQCRYTLVFRETTRLVDPRDAAGAYFYLQIRR